MFGRRSQVWHLPAAEDDNVILSSVGHFDPIDMPLVRLSISLCAFSQDCCSLAMFSGLLAGGSCRWNLPIEMLREGS